MDLALRLVFVICFLVPYCTSITAQDNDTATAEREDVYYDNNIVVNNDANILRSNNSELHNFSNKTSTNRTLINRITPSFSNRDKFNATPSSIINLSDDAVDVLYENETGCTSLTCNSTNDKLGDVVSDLNKNFTEDTVVHSGNDSEISLDANNITGHIIDEDSGVSDGHSINHGANSENDGKTSAFMPSLHNSSTPITPSTKHADNNEMLDNRTNSTVTESIEVTPSIVSGSMKVDEINDSSISDSHANISVTTSSAFDRASIDPSKPFSGSSGDDFISNTADGDYVSPSHTDFSRSAKNISLGIEHDAATTTPATKRTPTAEETSSGKEEGSTTTTVGIANRTKGHDVSSDFPDDTTATAVDLNNTTTTETNTSPISSSPQVSASHEYGDGTTKSDNISFSGFAESTTPSFSTLSSSSSPVSYKMSSTPNDSTNGTDNPMPTSESRGDSTPSSILNRSITTVFYINNNTLFTKESQTPSSPSSYSLSSETTTNVSPTSVKSVNVINKHELNNGTSSDTPSILSSNSSITTPSDELLNSTNVSLINTNSSSETINTSGNQTVSDGKESTVQTGSTGITNESTSRATDATTSFKGTPADGSSDTGVSDTTGSSMSTPISEDTTNGPRTSTTGNTTRHTSSISYSSTTNSAQSKNGTSDYSQQTTPEYTTSTSKSTSTYSSVSEVFGPTNTTVSADAASTSDFGSITQTTSHQSPEASTTVNQSTSSMSPASYGISDPASNSTIDVVLLQSTTTTSHKTTSSLTTVVSHIEQVSKSSRTPKELSESTEISHTESSVSYPVTLSSSAETTVDANSITPYLNNSNEANATASSSVDNSTREGTATPIDNVTVGKQNIEHKKAENLNDAEKQAIVTAILKKTTQNCADGWLDHQSLLFQKWLILTVMEGFWDRSVNWSVVDLSATEEHPKIYFISPTPLIRDDELIFTFLVIDSSHNGSIPADLLLPVLNSHSEKLTNVLNLTGRFQSGEHEPSQGSVVNYGNVLQNYGMLILAISVFVLFLAIVLLTLIICHRRRTRRSIHCITDRDKLHNDMQAAMEIGDINTAVAILRDELCQKGTVGNGNHVFSVGDDEGWLVPIGEVPVKDTNAPDVQDTKL